MKPIKIRAWDLINDKMIPWSDINAIEWCNDKLWFGDGNYRLLGNVLIMQHTGIGKIYEGDTVKTDLIEGVVIFDSGAFCIQVTKVLTKDAGYDIGQSPCLYEFNNIVVLKKYDGKSKK